MNVRPPHSPTLAPPIGGEGALGVSSVGAPLRRRDDQQGCDALGWRNVERSAAPSTTPSSPERSAAPTVVDAKAPSPPVGGARVGVWGGGSSLARARARAGAWG